MASKTFSAKFRSKREVWNFLTIDVGAYLPPYENVTIYHMRDLVTGKKKSKYFNHLFILNLILILFQNKIVIQADAIKVLHVP